MFKNILRTFKAEILETFKNIHPQTKNWTFLCKKECTSHEATRCFVLSFETIEVNRNVTNFALIICILFYKSVNIANHADPEIVKGEVVLFAMQKFSADFSRHYECYLVSGPSKANCLLMMYIDNQGVRLELEHAKYVPVIIQYGNIVSITLA